jgi:hypothetical protein
MDVLQKLFPADVARGRAEAEANLSAGVRKQRWSGKPGPGSGEVARLLRERYQVGVEVVGLCITDARVTACALGYNERMNEAILDRFGSDVVADTSCEVERKRKKRRRG